MAKRTEPTLGEEIIAGLKDAIAFAKGDTTRGRAHIPPDIDIKAIRGKLGLSQAAFAAKYGFSHGRVRDWEQGRTMPDPAARNFLRVIAAHPDLVDRTISSAA